MRGHEGPEQGELQRMCAHSTYPPVRMQNKLSFIVSVSVRSFCPMQRSLPLIETYWLLCEVLTLARRASPCNSHVTGASEPHLARLPLRCTTSMGIGPGILGFQGGQLDFVVSLYRHPGRAVLVFKHCMGRQIPGAARPAKIIICFEE